MGKFQLAAQDNAITPSADRAGWTFDIPGSCLKLTTKQWTPEQREKGIKVRCVELTYSEELEAAGEAQAEAPRVQGAALASNARKSMRAIGTAGAPVGAEDWQSIDAVERAALWELLGFKGRDIVVKAFAMSNAPTEAERSVLANSFRTEL